MAQIDMTTTPNWSKGPVELGVRLKDNFRTVARRAGFRSSGIRRWPKVIEAQTMSGDSSKEPSIGRGTIHARVFFRLVFEGIDRLPFRPPERVYPGSRV